MVLYVQSFDFGDFFGTAVYAALIIGGLFIINISHSGFWGKIFNNRPIIKTLITSRKWAML